MARWHSPSGALPGWHWHRDVRHTADSESPDWGPAAGPGPGGGSRLSGGLTAASPAAREAHWPGQAVVVSAIARTPQSVPAAARARSHCQSPCWPGRRITCPGRRGGPVRALLVPSSSRPAEPTEPLCQYSRGEPAPNLRGIMIPFRNGPNEKRELFSRFLLIPAQVARLPSSLVPSSHDQECTI